MYNTKKQYLELKIDELYEYFQNIFQMAKIQNEK